MVGHYLAGALRSFRRRPLNAAIKLLALALGLACLLTAHVIGDYFRQADRQWAKAERTYLILQEMEQAGGGWAAASASQSGSPAVAKYVRADIPELETVARMYMTTVQVRREGVERAWFGLYADPELLDIFDLDMVAGEASLARPGSVMISETAAQSLFGAENAIGQTLHAATGSVGTGVDVVVGGVFRDLPEDSHLGAAGQMSMHVLAGLEIWRQVFLTATPSATVFWWEQDNFTATNFTTYAVLPEDGSLTAGALNQRLASLAERRVPPGVLPGNLDIRFSALPIHKLSQMRFDGRSGLPAGISLVTGLYALGLLTLAIGCVNFANLAAAEAATRAREIGLRKTVGASRAQVAAQMLVESGLLVMLALLLALPIAHQLANLISSRFFIDIPMPALSRLDYWAGMAAIAAIVSLAAGSYPALTLARLRPIFAMRMTGLRSGSGSGRALLIGAQFAACGVLLVLVIVMIAQNVGLRRTALRPGEDPIVAVSMSGPRAQTMDGELARMETIRQELVSNPAVTGVTFSTWQPFGTQPGMLSEFGTSLDPGARRFTGEARRIYYDYFETMDVDVVAGRAFSRDAADLYSVIIDAGTAEVMGMTPQEAVGQPIYRTAAREAVDGADGAPPEYRIVGVVEREPLEMKAANAGQTNYVYVIQPTFMNFTLVRLSKDNVEGALAYLRATWPEFHDGAAPNVMFLDELFDQNYRTFRMMTFVVIGLSGIAAGIAAMGLFGLASFVVQRRMRELGIRKTLGASGPRVLGMMLWDFSKPVIVANLIAWPAAYLAARFYLNLFVTRIDLTPLPFLLALGASLVIAWLAVSVHALRAASVKPAMVLKTE